MIVISVGVLLTAGFACTLLLALRRRFTAHLDRIEAEIRKPSSGRGARPDLPPEVVALATRMGAHTDETSDFAVFEQSGQMWRTPGGKAMDFTARQSVRFGAPEFLWRAVTGPLSGVVVADYFVAGTGGLEAMLLGVFPLVRIIGGAGANQGEILRYLAELPWAPDAILANRSLVWTVLDAKTIKVATGLGAERGEITLGLNEAGLIANASAPSRLYAEKGRTTAHPWHGRFWDYQPMGGRLIPIRGEVAWTLDTGDFVYWQGRILGWRRSGDINTGTDDHRRSDRRTVAQ
jgi:hypothetical protein